MLSVLLIQLRGRSLKSYNKHFVPPVILAAQYISNLATNLRTFMTGDFHMKSGMKYLIKAFHRSIIEGAPVPIPSREILLTMRIMDAIFDQLGAGRVVGAPEIPRVISRGVPCAQPVRGG